MLNFLFWLVLLTLVAVDVTLALRHVPHERYPLPLQFAWLLVLATSTATMITHGYALIWILVGAFALLTHAHFLDQLLQTRRARRHHPTFRDLN